MCYKINLSLLIRFWNMEIFMPWRSVLEFKIINWTYKKKTTYISAEFNIDYYIVQSDRGLTLTWVP